jgi:hypothetical protein
LEWDCDLFLGGFFDAEAEEDDAVGRRGEAETG